MASQMAEEMIFPSPQVSSSHHSPAVLHWDREVDEKGLYRPQEKGLGFKGQVWGKVADRASLWAEERFKSFSFQKQVRQKNKQVWG